MNMAQLLFDFWEMLDLLLISDQIKMRGLCRDVDIAPRLFKSVSVYFTKSFCTPLCVLIR